MNAKLNLCTSRLLLTVLLLGASAVMGAQDRPYDRVKAGMLWSEGRNAAAMRVDSYSNTSFVELSGNYTSGGFHASNDASRAWEAGIESATLVSSGKVSMDGTFAFSQRQGEEMCGSMFITPGLYPIDVLEFTPGRKTLQTYSYSGAIAADLSGGWVVGARMDFLSQNYAKRKDLRHTNYRLDMSLAPSILYKGDGFYAGLAYIFRKDSESIQAEQIGTATADSYYAFLDKGMMFGAYEVWDGSGTHLSEAGVDRLPVSEYTNGAALQFGYGPAFAELEYLHSSGLVGEKSFDWYTFPGSTIGLRLAFRIADAHVLRLSVESMDQKLLEHVVEKVTENGVTNPKDWGTNQVFERNSFKVKPSYILNARKFYGDFSLMYERSQGLSSLVYPGTALRTTDILSASARGTFRFGPENAGLSRWEAGLSLDFLSGKSAEESNSEAFRLDAWNETSLEWQTAPRAGAGVLLRHKVIDGNVAGFFVEAGADCIRALREPTRLDGANRFDIYCKIGYTF